MNNLRLSRFPHALRKWVLVAGARPNFMKVAPLIRAVHAHNRQKMPEIHPLLVHTGQHYDANMSEVFFRDLELPEPDIHLDVGSGSHGEQTGKVLIAMEKVLLEEKPELVIVVGDVNSTLAGALAAAKLNIPVAHVEAGLRSFDRSMPEEINRLLTDAISDYLFTPSPDGNENLLREGIPDEKIFLVGDVMVDSLLFHLGRAKQLPTLAQFGLESNDKATDPPAIRTFGLLTLHRPSNVDDRGNLLKILEALAEVAGRIPILFPVHPRTRKQIQTFGFDPYFVPLSQYSHQLGPTGLYTVDPLSYLDFLNLMAHATMVLTDSGGIQEETSLLGVPCLTLRDTTERPITLTHGTNTLVWNDKQKIVQESNNILNGKRKKGNLPEKWDGKAAERIVAVLTANRR
jgi:UDP-N-acetylglucosamine 2-epimerase (non-hydrolysing)